MKLIVKFFIYSTVYWDKETISISRLKKHWSNNISSKQFGRLYLRETLDSLYAVAFGWVQLQL